MNTFLIKFSFILIFLISDTIFFAASPLPYGFIAFLTLSKNFWSTSGMMAPFYELLNTMANWLVKKGVKKENAQKYITSLFLALSEDAVVNSKKDLKYLVKESQTPKGLNEQGVNELRKLGFYKSTEKTLNSILKRLNKI